MGLQRHSGSRAFTKSRRDSRFSLERTGSLEVTISAGTSFEHALRQFNRLVQQSGILREARKREYFEPPSVVRKRKAATKRRKAAKAAKLDAAATANGPMRYRALRRGR